MAVYISDQIKHLDKILQKCKWRISNHYGDGEWRCLAKEVAGSDEKNPLFEGYIEYLVSEDLIKHEDPKYSSNGYIATTKGLIHEGFAAQKIRLDERQELEIESARASIQVSKSVIDANKNQVDYNKTSRTIAYLSAFVAVCSLILGLVSVSQGIDESKNKALLSEVLQQQSRIELMLSKIVK